MARDPADPQDCLARMATARQDFAHPVVRLDYAEAGGELVVRDGRRLGYRQPHRSTWPALRIQLAEPVNGRFEFEPCCARAGLPLQPGYAAEGLRSYLVGKPCSAQPSRSETPTRPRRPPRGAESGLQVEQRLAVHVDGAGVLPWITFQPSPCLR